MRRAIAVLLPNQSHAVILYDAWLRSRGRVPTHALVPQDWTVSDMTECEKVIEVHAVPLTRPGAGVRGERFDEIIILSPEIDYNLLTQAMQSLGGLQ